MGHCVLVFAFVPPLAALPGWIASELANPLNLRDPVVLGFLPVRGAILLLDAFGARVGSGLLAGLIAGLGVSAWIGSGRRTSTWTRRTLLGGIAGVVAAGLTLILERALGWAETPTSAALAFDVVSGMLCGALAAPGAVRLAIGIDGAETGPVDVPLPGA